MTTFFKQYVAGKCLLLSASYSKYSGLTLVTNTGYIYENFL
jgi:hypothetical protein